MKRLNHSTYELHPQVKSCRLLTLKITKASNIAMKLLFKLLNYKQKTFNLVFHTLPVLYCDASLSIPNKYCGQVSRKQKTNINSICIIYHQHNYRKLFVKHKKLMSKIINISLSLRVKIKQYIK